MNSTLNETLQKIAGTAADDSSFLALEKGRSLLLEGNIDAAEIELRTLNDVLLRFAIADVLHSAASANLSAETLESFITKFNDIFKRANWSDSVAKDEMVYFLFPVARIAGGKFLIAILGNGDFRIRAQQALVLKLLDEQLIDQARWLADAYIQSNVYAQERGISKIHVALAGFREMEKLVKGQEKSFKGGLPIHWLQDAIRSGTRKSRQEDSYDVTRFIGEAMKILLENNFGPADKNILVLIGKLTGKQMVNATGENDGRDEGVAMALHAMFDAIDLLMETNDIEKIKEWLKHTSLLIETWYLSFHHVKPTKIRQAKALYAIGEVQEAEQFLKTYKFATVQDLQLLKKYAWPANELVKSIITDFGEKFLTEGEIKGNIFDILIPISEHYGLSVAKYLEAAKNKSIDDCNGKDGPMLRRAGRTEDARHVTDKEYYPFDRSDCIFYYIDNIAGDFKTAFEELNYFSDPGYRAIAKVISLATNCEELTKATRFGKNIHEKDLYRQFYFEVAFSKPLSFSVDDNFMEALRELILKIKDQENLFQVVTYMRNYLRGHVSDEKLNALLRIAMKPLPAPLKFPENCNPGFLEVYKMMLTQKDFDKIITYLNSLTLNSDAWKDWPYIALIGSCLFACADKFSDEQKEFLVDQAATIRVEILHSDNYQDTRPRISPEHISFAAALTALCFSFQDEKKKIDSLVKLIKCSRAKSFLDFFCRAVAKNATREWITEHLAIFAEASGNADDFLFLKSMPEKEKADSPWSIYSSAEKMLAGFPEKMSNKDVDAFAKPFIKKKHPQVIVTDVAYAIPELVERATDKEYAIKICLDLLDITEMLPRDRSVIYAALGSAYIKMSDPVHAKVWFDKAIECARTEKKSTHFSVSRLMRAFLTGGDFKGLDEYLKTLALSIRGEWEENRLLNATCFYFMDTGREELFFDIIEKEPFSQEDKSWAARIWMRDAGNGRHASAFIRMLPMVASNPEHFSDSLYFLFRQFLQEKNPESALELLKKIEM